MVREFGARRSRYGAVHDRCVAHAGCAACYFREALRLLLCLQSVYFVESRLVSFYRYWAFILLYEYRTVLYR